MINSLDVFYGGLTDEGWRELLSQALRWVAGGKRKPKTGTVGFGHEPLSAAEQGVIRRWIAAGAPYTAHWSFAPLRRAADSDPAGHYRRHRPGAHHRRTGPRVRRRRARRGRGVRRR